MSKHQETIIFVDGSSYLYRAFHALPALTNSKGFATGAIYGIVSMLKKLIHDYQPDYMAVVFDTKGKTFRDHLYPAYKATRQAMPSELSQQIEPIHKIIRAMGLPLIAIEGEEADDVIGTLTTLATKKNLHSIISTGDKDLAQLVNAHVTLINTMTNVKLDIPGVKEKFGVPPELIIDYLTLIGDSSDNIPGVPQVGPKTAVKWLSEYGSLDQIIANATKISGKVGEKLRDSLEHIPLTKQLVTINNKIALSFIISEFKIKEPDKKLLIDIYREMEFKSWLAELLQETKEENISKQSHYEIIVNEKNLQQWIKKLNQAKNIAFFVKTNSMDYMQAKPVGIGFAISQGKACYIPFAHDYAGVTQQLSKDYLFKELKPILENSAIKKIAHNIKFIVEIFTQAKINLAGFDFDTMLESYILDSITSNHNLEGLSLKYLGYSLLPFENIAGKGVKQLLFNQLPIEKVGIYAAEQVDFTLQLHQTLWPRINKDENLLYIFEKIEMPLLYVLARMELNGVLIDTQKLRAQSKDLRLRLQELEKEAFALAGMKFNINSPKQLQEILFQKLNLPVLQKTPKGQASTADHVLQDLALDFALPRVIIEYRSLCKLMTTYTDKLIEQINPHTGRVHTSYNQTVTATGRLSSSNPNLQNIPARTTEGRRIRQAFIAPQGYQLISADYSQIELRLMAHISEDPHLLEAFSKNLDIHAATAAEVWQLDIANVTSEMRRNAKAINFGLIYGMSAFGLTRQLGIDRKAAQNYIDRYFERYPRVKKYMDDTRLKAKQMGYVETLWGRRLYLPDINASQIPRQKAAERAAINAPLQGSAADIIKMAMIKMDEWLKQNHVPAKMIMQVHDELVFEVHENHVDQVMHTIQDLMTHIVHLRVPLLVAINKGDNWDKASAH